MPSLLRLKLLKKPLRLKLRLRARLGADAHRVDVGLVLDAYDLGAEVGEDARGLGTGDDPGEVGDADSLEGEGVGRHWPEYRFGLNLSQGGRYSPGWAKLPNCREI